MDAEELSSLKRYIRLELDNTLEEVVRQKIVEDFRHMLEEVVADLKDDIGEAAESLKEALEELSGQQKTSA